MTVNLPGKLHAALSEEVRKWHYHSLSDYCVALALWDIYSRQHHEMTGPLLREPLWRVESFVDDLLSRRGERVPHGSLKPHRFTIRLPDPIYELVQVRKREEHYRGDSAYFVGLIIFAIDPAVPKEKGIPHHKLAPLLQEPKWVRDAVLSKIVAEFGKEDRSWPAQIERLVAEQLQLRLRA